jgi:hypothetical protein
VLEEVREPCPAHSLVLRADVIPLVDVNNGKLAVNVQYHLKAIRQRVLLKTYLRNRANRVGVSSGLCGRRRRIAAPTILRGDRQKLREDEKQHERERDLSGSKSFHEELLSSVESKKNGKAGIIIQVWKITSVILC